MPKSVFVGPQVQYGPTKARFARPLCARNAGCRFHGVPVGDPSPPALEDGAMRPYSFWPPFLGLLMAPKRPPPNATISAGAMPWLSRFPAVIGPQNNTSVLQPPRPSRSQANPAPNAL